MVDLKKATFLFINPLCVNELKDGKKLMGNFTAWTKAYNTVVRDRCLPTKFQLRVIPHARQEDGRNCGIWTLWVSIIPFFRHLCVTCRSFIGSFAVVDKLCLQPLPLLTIQIQHLMSFISLQFARRILEKKHVMHAVVGDEGARIAMDILAASESISSICAKCGLNLFVDSPPLKMCSGNCRPRKTFHVKCLPEVSRHVIKFYCQVCDPSTREEFCFKCSRAGGEGPLAYCANGDFTGCTNFIHVKCLAPGSANYICGLCTLRIN